MGFINKPHSPTPSESNTLIMLSNTLIVLIIIL